MRCRSYNRQPRCPKGRSSRVTFTRPHLRRTPVHGQLPEHHHPEGRWDGEGQTGCRAPGGFRWRGKAALSVPPSAAASPPPAPTLLSPRRDPSSSRRGCTPTSSSAAVPTERSRLARIQAARICPKRRTRRWSGPSGPHRYVSRLPGPEPEGARGARTSPQTTQARLNPKFRSRPARRESGAAAPGRTPTPSLPPAAPPRPVTRSAAARAGPARQARGPDPAGGTPGGPARREGCATAAPAPSPHTDKRTGCRRPRAGRGPRILRPAAEAGLGSVFTRRLGAPLRSGALGPASGQTDRRTMGPGSRLGPAGPELSRTGPRRTEDGSGPSWWRGAEGRRCRRTKPTADRRTEGEKDGDTGGGSALLAHPQRAGRVHERLPSPRGRSPLPAPRARAGRRGRGLEGEGPGRRDFREHPMPGVGVGGCRLSPRPARPRSPASPGPSLCGPVSPSTPHPVSCEPGFPHPPSSSATKPTSPGRRRTAGSPSRGRRRPGPAGSTGPQRGARRPRPGRGPEGDPQVSFGCRLLSPESVCTQGWTACSGCRLTGTGASGGGWAPPAGKAPAAAASLRPARRSPRGSRGRAKGCPGIARQITISVSVQQGGGKPRTQGAPSHAKPRKGEPVSSRRNVRWFQYHRLERVGQKGNQARRRAGVGESESARWKPSDRDEENGRQRPKGSSAPGSPETQTRAKLASPRAGGD
ncbi:collagen alpha-1(I) chain-like [Oryctolagus cuniculus]|uniref:collagen alpha-1(I) chain-like n=1 Tax=Oryctolagus cuniculus TaxID=9986 RepID=UPI003879FF5E